MGELRAKFSNTAFFCSHKSDFVDTEMVQEIYGQIGGSAQIYMDDIPKHRIRGRTGSSQSEYKENLLVLFASGICINRDKGWSIFKQLSGRCLPKNYIDIGIASNQFGPK